MTFRHPLRFLLLEMPSKQTPGWTRRGPGTFTSDEFDSDDQTPPSPVSKVPSNKPISGADAVLGILPISGANTLMATHSAQNFASYLGKREVLVEN